MKGPPRLPPIPRRPPTGLSIPLALLTVWALLWSLPPAHSQVLLGGLTDDELLAHSENLTGALAGPREPAFLQVLTEATIMRSPVDTIFVYDIVVRYDPTRYRDRHGGMYPISFVDQFILWGKRVALYTRSTDWTSRRSSHNGVVVQAHARGFTRARPRR